MTIRYIEARRRWERQQKERFGCNYVGGVCMVHVGNKKPKESEKEPDRAATALRLSKINFPHLLSTHDKLDSDHDWRTPGERARNQRP
jgi:hypothetical protein